MNRLSNCRDEVHRLASSLCDGEISPKEIERLESLASQSPEALDRFLHYVHLHAELTWTMGTVSDRATARRGVEAEMAVPGPEASVVCAPRRKTGDRWMGIAATVAVLLVVGVVVSIVILSGPAPRQPRLSEPVVVATLTRSEDAAWADREAPNGEGADLVSGQLLRLESGAAQVRFVSGARVVLDGRREPAEFVLSTTNSGALHLGRLTAIVPPRAVGFTVVTPSGAITDQGTEIGVAVEGQRTSEVHVFTGKVQVRPGAASDPSPPQDVSAGGALRITLAGASAPRIQAIRVDSGSFLRSLPARGPVERLRELVVCDPRLIHHYPFEGIGRKDKCADRWGRLNLTEVRMHGGEGGLDIYESAPGLDTFTSAVRPYRSPRDGDTVGVGLGSEAAFEPPHKFTVELLFRLETSAGPINAMVAAAVAFSANPAHGGALGVAADRGHLVFCLGQSSSVGADRAAIEPDRWYYVAATFEVTKDETMVNGYLADLTEGDGQLVQVAQDVALESVPASGPLGIGKGFDRNGADAYPWPGRLDEIAIYGAVLDRQTLEQHLAALVEKP